MSDERKQSQAVAVAAAVMHGHTPTAHSVAPSITQQHKQPHLQSLPLVDSLATSLPMTTRTPPHDDYHRSHSPSPSPPSLSSLTSLIVEKERELLDMHAYQRQIIAEQLRQKCSDYDILAAKHHQLREDFLFNLSLLRERDDELEKQDTLLESLNNKINENEITAHGCNNEISMLHSEISVLKEKLRENEMFESERVQQLNLAHSAKIQLLTDDLTRVKLLLEEEKNAFHHQLKLKDLTMESERRELLKASEWQFQQEAKKYRDDLHSEQRVIEDRDNQIRTLMAEIEEWKSSNQSVANDVAELTERLTATDRNRLKLQLELSDRDTELQKSLKLANQLLVEEKKKLNDSILSYEERLTSATIESKNLAAANNQLLESNQRLQQQLTQWQGEVKEAESQKVSELKLKFSELQDLYEGEKFERMKFENEIKNQRNHFFLEIDELKFELAEAKNALVDREKSNQSALWLKDEELASLNQRIQLLVSQQEERREELVRLKQASASHNEVVRRLRAEKAAVMVVMESEKRRAEQFEALLEQHQSTHARTAVTVPAPVACRAFSPTFSDDEGFVSIPSSRPFTPTTNTHTHTNHLRMPLSSSSRPHSPSLSQPQPPSQPLVDVNTILAENQSLKEQNSSIRIVVTTMKSELESLMGQFQQQLKDKERKEMELNAKLLALQSPSQLPSASVSMPEPAPAQSDNGSVDRLVSQLTSDRDRLITITNKLRHELRKSHHPHSHHAPTGRDSNTDSDAASAVPSATRLSRDIAAIRASLHSLMESNHSLSSQFEQQQSAMLVGRRSFDSTADSVSDSVSLSELSTSRHERADDHDDSTTITITTTHTPSRSHNGIGTGTSTGSYRSSSAKQRVKPHNSLPGDDNDRPAQSLALQGSKASLTVRDHSDSPPGSSGVNQPSTADKLQNLRERIKQSSGVKSSVIKSRVRNYNHKPSNGVD